MATILQSKNSCPKWDGEVPAGAETVFRERAALLYRRIADQAAAAIVADSTTREWHAVLFANFVPLNYYAGNFRCVDPELPCLARDVRVGGAAGSPHQVVKAEMYSCFESFDRDVRQLELSWGLLTAQQRALGVSMVLATIIGEFIRVHPFLNGNGRVSRYMWMWGLLRFGAPPQCAIAPRPPAPYDSVMAAAMTGDFVPLAQYILLHLASHPPKQTTSNN